MQAPPHTCSLQKQLYNTAMLAVVPDVDLNFCFLSTRWSNFQNFQTPLFLIKIVEMNAFNFGVRKFYTPAVLLAHNEQYFLNVIELLLCF